MACPAAEFPVAVVAKVDTGSAMGEWAGADKTTRSGRD